MGSVLIIDRMHESIVSLLKESHLKADYRPDIERPEILKILPAYMGLIVRSKTMIDRELIDHGSSLQFVARAGAGMDNIDVDYLLQRNVVVLNAPEGNQDALAEQAMGMLLNLTHRISAADRQVRAGVWDRERNRGTEVMGKTVALIGYGHMGRAFAQRLRSFGCQVLAYDKYKQGFSDQFALESSLETLQEQAEIISLHVPLTDETRGFYNFEFFSKFNRQLLVINTARGEIMPLEDLVRLLQSGKIIGAALDVLPQEPITKLIDSQKDVFEYLSNSQQVLFTPHVAGWSQESYQRINQVLISKISQLLLEGRIK